MTVLLDSVILIDYLNEVAAAQDYVEPLYKEQAAVVSVVTTAEVLTGIRGEGERNIIEYLDSFPLLNLGREDAIETARLRRAHGWKLPDAFQAALALRHGLKLATRNTRDFDPTTHDFVAVPYTL